MNAPAITMDVRRFGESTAVVDIRGEVTAACEPVLMSAYEAAGGTWVTLAVTTEQEWQALAGCIGIDGLATDSRYAGAEARTANDNELAAALEARFAERRAEEW